MKVIRKRPERVYVEEYFGWRLVTSTAGAVEFFVFRTFSGRVMPDIVVGHHYRSDPPYGVSKLDYLLSHQDPRPASLSLETITS